MGSLILMSIYKERPNRLPCRFALRSTKDQQTLDPDIPKAFFTDQLPTLMSRKFRNHHNAEVSVCDTCRAQELQYRTQSSSTGQHIINHHHGSASGDGVLVHLNVCLCWISCRWGRDVRGRFGTAIVGGGSLP